MANVLNMDAEVGANMIGDDAEPTLRITNSSTGSGLSTDKLMSTSGATIVSGTAAGIPLTVGKTAVGSMTIPAMVLQVASVASGAAIQLTGTAFVSVTTIKFITGGVAGSGALRVMYTDGATLGWIPLLPDAAVTAAAVA